MTLPEHLAAEIDEHAALVGLAPAKFLAGLVGWWYGLGSPAVSDDEKQIAGTMLVSTQPGRNSPSRLAAVIQFPAR